MSKCKWEGCENEAVAIGYCSEHKNDYYKAGYKKGIYKLFFTNSKHFYIGMTILEGINLRFSKHKNYLVKQCLKKVNKEERLLVEHFNNLCKSNKELTRKEVFDKFVRIELIKGIPIFLPVDLSDNSISFSDDIQDKRDSCTLIKSDNPVIQKEISKVKTYCHNRELEEIKMAKQEDKENGTNYCLNINEGEIVYNY